MDRKEYSLLATYYMTVSYLILIESVNTYGKQIMWTQFLVFYLQSWPKVLSPPPPTNDVEIYREHFGFMYSTLFGCFIPLMYFFIGKYQCPKTFGHDCSFVQSYLSDPMKKLKSWKFLSQTWRSVLSKRFEIAGEWWKVASNGTISPAFFPNHYSGHF